MLGLLSRDCGLCCFHQIRASDPPVLSADALDPAMIATRLIYNGNVVPRRGNTTVTSCLQRACRLWHSAASQPMSLSPGRSEPLLLRGRIVLVSMRGVFSELGRLL